MLYQRNRTVLLLNLMLLLPVLSSAWSNNGNARKIAVIGGGASGMFAAIAAGEEWLRCNNNNNNSNNSHHKKDTVTGLSIHVLEATRHTLTKVKNSGGGRCNVLHDTTKTIPDLLAGYPRGTRELQGIFHKRFTPQDAQAWFERHGVTLKTEADGRMFPTTDSSQTIIDSLLFAADRTGVVRIETKQIVKDLKKQQQEQVNGDNSNNYINGNKKFGGWIVSSSSSSLSEDIRNDVYDAVILATGSSPTGYRLAANVGHEVVSPVPSLFTLSTEQMVQPGGLFHGLSGVSVPWARISLELPSPSPPTTTTPTPEENSRRGRTKRSKQQQHLEQEGPLLITHQGLSGPAALRLSAFAARDLYDLRYRATVYVHWAPTVGDTPADIFHTLSTQVKLQWPKKFVTTLCPWPQANIPKRLWSALVQQGAGIPESITWSQVSHASLQELSRCIAACPIHMTGKNRFADEFVTAGGLNLKQVDMTTMQSKLHPGLFMCGEILDVDGITGGYNFMNCWSTGYVAGCAAVHHVLQQEQQQQEQQQSPATKATPRRQ